MTARAWGEIRSGEVPPPIQRGKRRCLYPFADMEVGHYFDMPRDMGRTRKDNRQASVASAACGYARRHNPAARFITRLVDEHTVRCWRIA